MSLWSALSLMYRLPGQRLRVWECYRASARCDRLGVNVLDVASGVVFGPMR